MWIYWIFYKFSQESLKKSLLSLAHRGPDNSGYIYFDHINVGLGHTRLSIIDLSEDGKSANDFK